MFQLGKLTFDVKSARISGAYYEPSINQRAGSGNAEEAFLWFIDIDMAEGEFAYQFSEEELAEEDLDEEDEYFYESAAPRLYHNNGFQIAVSSWKDLEGKTLNWDCAYNENEEEAGTLCVFEHEEVTRGKIEILKRHEQSFLLRWSGTANVFWSEEYGADVPFLFEGEVAFTGLSAHSDVALTEAEVRAAMDKFIRMDEFSCKSQTCHQVMHGNTYGWNFVPAE